MAHRSNFLTLPGEIRNTIYEYSLPDVSNVSINREGHAQPPAIAQVCRQIRAEVTGYLQALHWPLVKTLTAKVIDCDFRHVIKMCQALTQADTENIECLQMRISLTERGMFDPNLLAQGADTVFRPLRRLGMHQESPYNVHTIVGGGSKRIRHGLVVDTIHTSEEHRSCACLRFQREGIYFGDHTEMSTTAFVRNMLCNDILKAFRDSHFGPVGERLKRMAALKPLHVIQSSNTAQQVHRAGGKDWFMVGSARRNSDSEVEVKLLSVEKEPPMTHRFRRLGRRYELERRRRRAGKFAQGTGEAP